MSPPSPNPPKFLEGKKLKQPVYANPPARTPFLAAPCMNKFHLADGTILNDANSRTVLPAAMNLNTHLCDESFLSGYLGESARFVDVVGQWLLTIDMKSPLETFHPDGAMHMIWSGDVDRIDVLLLFQKFAPILINSSFGILFANLTRSIQINVRDRRQSH